MTLLNTTFHVHSSVNDFFIEWVKGIYIPTAMKSECLSNPLFTRIMMQIDPDATSYAVQFHANSHNEAELWHDSIAAQLKEELAKKVGENVLFFSTYMEIID